MWHNTLMDQDENDDVPAPEPVTVTAGPGHTGARLDRFLADTCPELSRTRFRALIETGLVTRGDHAITDPAHKVKADEVYTFIEPAPIDAVPIPENIPLDIVYEDDDLLVINKHANMVVHPGAGHNSGTLVHALLYHCGQTLSGIGGVKRPGIVHRLDRGTSGLMLVAKHDQSHHALQAQLQDRSLGRIYDALVFKVPMPRARTIDAPIGRHPHMRLKMAIGGSGARPAQTQMRVQTIYGAAAARIECKLATGRTHQIRVHMASIGHPLIGDPLYGPPATALRAALNKDGYAADTVDMILSFPRQALHAREIHFLHPRTGEARSFAAAPPDDFDNLINALAFFAEKS